MKTWSVSVWREVIGEGASVELSRWDLEGASWPYPGSVIPGDSEKAKVAYSTQIHAPQLLSWDVLVCPGTLPTGGLSPPKVVLNLQKPKQCLFLLSDAVAGAHLFTAENGLELNFHSFYKPDSNADSKNVGKSFINEKDESKKRTLT